MSAQATLDAKRAERSERRDAAVTPTLDAEQKGHDMEHDMRGEKRKHRDASEADSGSSSTAQRGKRGLKTRGGNKQRLSHNTRK